MGCVGGKGKDVWRPSYKKVQTVGNSWKGPNRQAKPFKDWSRQLGQLLSSSMLLSNAVNISQLLSTAAICCQMMSAAALFCQQLSQILLTSVICIQQQHYFHDYQFKLSVRKCTQWVSDLHGYPAPPYSQATPCLDCKPCCTFSNRLWWWW